jgi:beta-lactamase regulating signal transducer with metallopeptidase domain
VRGVAVLCLSPSYSVLSSRHLVVFIVQDFSYVAISSIVTLLWIFLGFCFLSFFFVDQYFFLSTKMSTSL